MTKKSSLLWEVRHNDILKGYIFGTMHVPMNVAFSNTSIVYNAIDNCQAFATEIPLDDDAQREMGKHLHLPENVELKSLISEKKYDKYSKVLMNSFGITLDPFNKVLPLFVLNYITQKALMIKGHNMTEAMDFQLWNYAKQQGKIMTSVESLEDHIGTLYKIPLEYQLKALKSVCKDIPKFRKKTKEMLQMYLDQDIHKLYHSSKKSLSGIKEVLLYDRNIIMVNNFKELCKEQSVFVAVGAGHLSGKLGLISGIKALGYKVKPIRK